MFMNLRILTILNPSAFGLNDHKWRPHMDSGWTLVKNAILEMNKICDYHFYVLFPDFQDKVDSPYYQQIWENKPDNVTMIPYPYMNDAMSNRYNLNIKYLHSLSQYKYDFDLIWCFQPELLSGLKAWMNKRRDEIPMVCYSAWIRAKDNDGGFPPAYHMASLAGLVDSNRFLLQSEHMKQTFLDEIAGHEYINVDKLPLEKIEIMTPKIQHVEYEEVPEENMIAFPHRLYGHSNWKKCFDLTLPIIGDNKLWITDINNNYHGKDKEILKQGFDNWDEYFSQLRKCKFGVSYHTGYSMWTMSVLDCMQAGIPVLVPNKNAFPEMMPEGYKYMFKDKNEYEELFKELMDMSEEERRAIGKQLCDRVHKQYTWRTCAEQLRDIFEYEMNHKFKMHTENTQKVLDLIKNDGYTSKHAIFKSKRTDYIIMSRSWHVTRAELIRDHGILDDMTQTKPVFVHPDFWDEYVKHREEHTQEELQNWRSNMQAYKSNVEEKMSRVVNNKSGIEDLFE